MQTKDETIRRVAAAVDEYKASSDFAALYSELGSICSTADVEHIIAAAEPFLGIPEVAGPIYERVVAQKPSDARALVVLAGAYWVTGRGPEVVGKLAARARAADPANRGAWHLWAITEENPRRRTERWQSIVSRFPEDMLALANLADNAASLAGAEQDPVALAIAMDSYKTLLANTTKAEERRAIESALTTLRNWRF